MVGRQVDKVILFPSKRGSKCGKMDKKRNAGRRGFDSPRARRFAYSSVKWNRCAAKSASLMASSLSAVWQTSAAISLSMSGKGQLYRFGEIGLAAFKVNPALDPHSAGRF